MDELKFDEIVYEKLEDFTTSTGWRVLECEAELCIRIVSVADFPSEYGHFQIIGFVNNKEGEEDHCAIIKGNLGEGWYVIFSRDLQGAIVSLAMESRWILILGGFLLGALALSPLAAAAALRQAVEWGICLKNASFA